MKKKLFINKLLTVILIEFSFTNFLIDMSLQIFLKNIFEFLVSRMKLF